MSYIAGEKSYRAHITRGPVIRVSKEIDHLMRGVGCVFGAKQVTALISATVTQRSRSAQSVLVYFIFCTVLIDVCRRDGIIWFRLVHLKCLLKCS